MAKVFLICGKICCGKTTYAEKLCAKNNAVLLSVDEITLALFGQHCGDKHDDYVERTEKYLLNKSLELIQKDINVVLDWGFWTNVERLAVKEFYKSRDIECELHYIEISDEIWSYRLNKRNNDVLANETSAYYVDENLAAKFASMFEVPSEAEFDVVYQGDIMSKFDCFLQNAKILNDKFNIVPLLYGSLGLEILTNSSLNADDIDILIPQVFVTGDRWKEFNLFLDSHGYTLIDEHEHTFCKDGVDYSYASIEGLKEFAGIDICDIEIRNISGTKFMLLSLEQYLKVYQRSSQDGYRMNVKEKQDNQKIDFIRNKLNIN